MKLMMITIAASSLIVALAGAHSPTDSEARSRSTRYAVSDLGKVGGNPGQPRFVANNGLVSGAAAIRNGSMHAVLWFNGLKLDIGAAGLGGVHSVAFGVNEEGQAVGEAETSAPDTKTFAASTHLACFPRQRGAGHSCGDRE